MNEPLYLNISSSKSITVNGGTNTFNSVNSDYFTYNSTTLTTKIQTNLTDFILYDKQTQFTAPESFTRDPSKASDIYSAGILLYFLLSGSLPFDVCL